MTHSWTVFAQRVSLCSGIAEFRVQSPAKFMCHLCWTQWHRERFLLRIYLSFPLSTSFHLCPVPLHSSITDAV